jgi:hypothetical protein
MGGELRQSWKEMVMKHIFLVALASIGFAPAAHALVCHTNRASGEVVAPNLIRMRAFYCDINHISGISYFNKDPVHDQRPSLTMSVAFRDPADAARMTQGAFVTLRGDFQTTREGNTDRLTVRDARILTVTNPGSH